jgi:hypothetical protein
LGGVHRLGRVKQSKSPTASCICARSGGKLVAVFSRHWQGTVHSPARFLFCPRQESVTFPVVFSRYHQESVPFTPSHHRQKPAHTAHQAGRLKHSSSHLRFVPLISPFPPTFFLHRCGPPTIFVHSGLMIHTFKMTLLPSLPIFLMKKKSCIREVQWLTNKLYHEIYLERTIG